MRLGNEEEEEVTEDSNPEGAEFLAELSKELLGGVSDTRPEIQKALADIFGKINATALSNDRLND